VTVGADELRERGLERLSMIEEKHDA